MPCEISWEPAGVYKRFSGYVSFAEYKRNQELVLSDQRVDNLRYVINDLLAVEKYSITRDEAEESASLNYGSSVSNPRLRVAIVTTDLVLIGLTRFASMFSSLKLNVFPTVEEARRWVAGS